jgi:hypothetical protein
VGNVQNYLHELYTALLSDKIILFYRELSGIKEPILLPVGEGGPKGRMRVGRWADMQERPSPFRVRTTAAPPCAQALSQKERVF